jgi:hypothetical protein
VDGARNDETLDEEGAVSTTTTEYNMSVWQVLAVLPKPLPEVWLTSTPMEAAELLAEGAIVRLGDATPCHKCGKPIDNLTGSTGNVTHDGKPWCGCCGKLEPRK